MLETYARKRNFDKTAEPTGHEKLAARDALTFVIQKHSAKRLHYDFRLECDGVLLSWAVPKGPSLDPASKRLAVMVEDHPISYGNFEGVIPAGQYGGGEVIVWDCGTYCPAGAIDRTVSRRIQEKEIKTGLKKGKLSITLYGKKLHGSWTLVKTRRNDQDWLLIKHSDEYTDTRYDITTEERSVLSKKTIASLEKSNPDKKNKAVTPPKKTVRAVKKKAMTNTRKHLPERPRLSQIKPMLASLASRPFSRQGWIYEPKFDGIRALAYIQDGNVELKSRGGLDLNHRFPDLLPWLSKNKNMIVDGEIVALDAEGRPSFQLLQSSERPIKAGSKGKHIVYYVFDMLAEDGASIQDQPLKDRKARLKKQLYTARDVKYVDDLKCDGETAFALCLEKGLEGIVAKRLGAPYQAGKRSPDWMKVKATQSAEFVICGYTKGTGSREKTFGSLLIGHYKNKRLLYAGAVGTGFDQDQIKSLLAKLKPLVRTASPFQESIKDRGKLVWVKPVLVAEIKYAEWTADGKLRAPVFLRLRQDVSARETGPPAEIAPPGALRQEQEIDGSQERLSEALTDAGDSLKIEVDGYPLSFSHLDKLLWPGKSGKGLTKRDYAAYLLQVAPYILPHLKDRPLTLVRFPDGANGQRFFQKHWDKNLPPFVQTFEHFAEHSNENHRFLLCNNLATLLWLSQIADLELHTSHARIGKASENKSLTMTYTDSIERIERSTLNFPDYLVLDLDPYIYSGKELKGEEPALNRRAFGKVCKLAIILRDMLADMKIDSFVKTSGRTGLHIYVPILRNLDYDQVRLIAETIGKHLLAAHPREVTMDWSVVKRTGKIFFDHNMNARTKTLASIYSPRMSQTGTVSLPIDWDELTSIYPEDFTLKTVPSRLASVGDLWSDILKHKQNLKRLFV